MEKPVVYLREKPHCGLRGLTSSCRGSDTEVSAFLGIPFAEPPVGSLRFRPPKPNQLWNGVLDATRYGSICPQDLNKMKRNYGFLPNIPTEYNEDCLFLNVWSPNPINRSRKLPVMVWIHGGAFVQGCSNLYDGTALAAHENVVVISINYRMGVFGFLYTGSGPEDYHGNQGLLDQIEALRWVQKYIENFGGDPDNVTVFGESAGGISISLLQSTPLARGLFHRSICESGASLYANVLWTREGGEKYYLKRLHSMGFRGRSSGEVTRFLDSKSTDQCMESFNDWFAPSIQDGVFLKDEPLETYSKGSFHPVDTMIGFNSSEGNTFVDPNISTREGASKYITAQVAKNFYRGRHPTAVEKICKLAVDEYVGTLAPNKFPREAACDFLGDINFVAPSLWQAELHSRRARTYVYLFDHRPFFSPHPAYVRADHANEVPFVFGFPFRRDLPDSFPKEEQELSRRMMNYWANFARTGNPNGDGHAVWNQFTEDNPLFLPLRIPESSVESAKTFIPERARLWNRTAPALFDEYEKRKAKY